MSPRKWCINLSNIVKIIIQHHLKSPIYRRAPNCNFYMFGNQHMTTQYPVSQLRIGQLPVSTVFFLMSPHDSTCLTFYPSDYIVSPDRQGTRGNLPLQWHIVTGMS